jgi:hypothetical protein
MNKYKVTYRPNPSSGVVIEDIEAKDAGHAWKAVNDMCCGSAEILSVEPLDIDAGYECCEPSFVDDGELSGLTPQTCFTLGVEWQMVRQGMESGGPFNRPIHQANRERVMRLLIRNGRKYHITKPEDGWCQLSVL